MLPAKKTSKARTRTRRAHHALGAPAFVMDADTGEVRRTHCANSEGKLSNRKKEKRLKAKATG